MQVLSFDGDEVFRADLTLIENATTGKNYLDMSRVDALFKLQTGCMKVVFLNRFVQDLLVCFHCFAMSSEITCELMLSLICSFNALTLLVG